MNLKLVKKIIECQNTKSFFFEVDDSFTWIPGQYIYLTLPKLNYPDPRGETRDFTVSSSPTEGKIIRVTTRIRQSGYKKTLDELKIGDTASGNGPYGSFIFNPKLNNTNNIFLAGGIGITPFRSFIKYNIDKKLNIPMHLIYSNNNESKTTFKDELEKLNNEYDFINVNFHYSNKKEHLDISKLKILISNNFLLKSIFWIVGPPRFVTAMENVLEKLNVASDKIRLEKFTGY